jgi:hypothetical protein
MMVFLAAPMVRECCLPVNQALPCHESRQTDDKECVSNQQAITETKSNLARITIECRLPLAAVYSEELALTGRPAERVPLLYAHAIDICLHTGALLI